MSKIRTAALSAVALVGFAVFASAQVPAKPDSTWHRGDRHGKMGTRQEMGRRAFGRGHGEGKLMKDLNLSDAQKSRIKSIHEKYRPQFEALRKQNEPAFKALRDARQKGDTSAATRARFRSQMEQLRTRSQAIRQQEQNEVRAVLTADQRAKWDAAAKERQARFEQRKQHQGDRRQGRGKA